MSLLKLRTVSTTRELCLAVASLGSIVESDIESWDKLEIIYFKKYLPPLAIHVFDKKGIIQEEIVF